MSDNAEIPKSATKTVESQTQELRKVAAKGLILIVLDGIYFFCLDPAPVSSYLSSRHVGLRARAPILVYRPGYCVEASGGA